MRVAASKTLCTGYETTYKNSFHDSDRPGSLKEVTDYTRDRDSHRIVSHADSDDMVSDREAKEGENDLVGDATEMDKSRDTTGGALDKAKDVAKGAAGEAEALASETHDAISGALAEGGRDQNTAGEAVEEMKNGAVQDGVRDATGEGGAKDVILGMGAQDPATGDKAQEDAATGALGRVQDTTVEVSERAKGETAIEEARDISEGAACEETHDKVVGDSTRLPSDMAGDATKKIEDVADEVGNAAVNAARETRDIVREAADSGKEVSGSQEKISTSDKSLGGEGKVDSSSEKAKVCRDSQRLSLIHI